MLTFDYNISPTVENLAPLPAPQRVLRVLLALVGQIGQLEVVDVPRHHPTAGICPENNSVNYHIDQ